MARPKKVDEWWYSVDAVMQKQVPKERDPEAEEGEEPELETVHRMEEKKVKVEVFMAKKTEEDKTPPHTLQEVEFLVTCEEMKISLSGTDIECLRKAVWSQLDKKFEIPWFEYYKVDIVTSRIYGEDGTGFDFFWDSVWKGITYDGQALLREYQRWSRNGDTYKITAWPGAFKSRDGHVVACIPKNEMTEKALLDFKARLELLRDKLQELLTPEAIMQTLTNLGGVLLLPAAVDQVGAEEKVIAEKKATVTPPAE